MIILLNGIAGSGKTTIIKELQKHAPFPLLRLGIDDCLSMMPEQYYGYGAKAHEGIQFIQDKGPDGPSTRVHNGEFGKAVLHAIPLLVATLAYQDLCVVCDEVLFQDYYLTQYTKAFKNHKAYFIGVTCDLETLLKREEKRGRNGQGLARDQVDRVHGPTRYYDFVVDTTQLSPEESAKKILRFIRENPSPTSFKKLECLFGV